MSLSDMAEAKGVKQETVISYIEELVGEDVDISYLKKEFSYKELDTILDAFEECETTTLSPVYEYLSKKKKKTTYAKLRLARLFI
jgi:hypothetical protein